GGRACFRAGHDELVAARSWSSCCSLCGRRSLTDACVDAGRRSGGSIPRSVTRSPRDARPTWCGALVRGMARRAQLGVLAIARAREFALDRRPHRRWNRAALMAPYFPNTTVEFKIEEPPAFRRFTTSIAEMAI